jgi:hypothetical protein
MGPSQINPQTVATFSSPYKLNRFIKSVFVDSKGTPIYCGGGQQEDDDPSRAGCFRLTPEAPRAAAAAPPIFPSGSLSNVQVSGANILTYTDPDSLLEVNSTMVGWG